MGAAFGAAVFLSRLTHGLSLLVLSALGLTFLLHGWGLLTGWAGVWDRHVERERARVANAEDLPLARTGIGRAVISYNRSDHESSRGLMGLGALIAGIMFIVFGVLGAFSVIEFT
jgi:hypothetical protein